MNEIVVRPAFMLLRCGNESKMIEFPVSVNLRCNQCNRSPLFIYAFLLSDDEAIPVLVCDPHYGCGHVMELHEYGLKGEKERDYRDWLEGFALV